ncbi:RidA family protein [Microbulbifer sp. ANSA001]|uniref:RidA family protein n=1 Tax=Microbulbifer sp. ANSA001 TaxID=3243358 RepID=UPI004042DB95
MSNLFLNGLGHYSPIDDCKNGTFLLSGVKAWNLLDNGEIKGTIEQQTLDIFKGVDEILLSRNLYKNNIARVQCFLTNIEEYEAFNKAYSQYMNEHIPARTVIGVSQLRFKAKIELVIDCHG